ncbi:MAG: DUF4855 domain-containing protein [Firmicutes bacterium]|nr:DUF4855 domain-containing protein [Bacillota bacterium]MDD4694278.1 DUF4855 domain-containing protein [Bacillota bacterium]
MQKFVLLFVLVLFLMPRFAKASDKPLKNLALNKPYEITAAWPDDFFHQTESDYKDSESRELTDGEFGSLRYQDSAWQSFLRQGGRTIVVDLGEVKTVNEITGHFLQFWEAGIYVPRFLDYYLSLDNERFAYMGQVETNVGPWNRKNQKEQFTLKDLNHQARYVKIQFPTDVFVFMDEIEVFGVDEILPGSLELQITEEKALEKLWEKSAILGPEALSARGYLPKGSAEAAGAEHIVLLYYAYPPAVDKGSWASFDFIPYVSYISEDSMPKDWLFDTILMLPQGATPSGNKLYATDPSHAATIDDWLWYVEETFLPERQVSALNKAVKTCGNLLQDQDHKVKVVLSLVSPSPFQNDFGPLEKGGESLNFNYQKVGDQKALENRLTAVKWLIDQLICGFEKADTDNLELIGLYWTPESIVYHQSPSDDEFVRKVSELVHEKGLKFFWIPFYGAAGSYDWRNFGFDAVMLQPNYVFSDTEEERVKAAATTANHLGMGIEMEKHWNDTSVERNKWRDYLNGGVKYGYMNALVGYYQSFNDLSRAAMTYNSRSLYYDSVYQFIKGKYKIPDQD